MLTRIPWFVKKIRLNVPILQEFFCNWKIPELYSGIKLFWGLLQHIFNKYSVSDRGIVYHNVSHGADKLAVLNDGASAHECVNIGPTSFLGNFRGNFCKNTPKQAIFGLLRLIFISHTYNNVYHWAKKNRRVCYNRTNTRLLFCCCSRFLNSLVFGICRNLYDLSYFISEIPFNTDRTILANNNSLDKLFCKFWS